MYGMPLSQMTVHKGKINGMPIGEMTANRAKLDNLLPELALSPKYLHSLP